METDKRSDEMRELTRRELLAAAAGVTAAYGLLDLASVAGAAETGGEIDPGFFASQFYGAEEAEAVGNVVESGSPFRFWGPGRPKWVENFEENWAKYLGAKFALAVTSGTAALDCAIAALEIGPGDEVILPAYTWWSDYTCVVHAGALPVFADIDDSLNLDPEDFARRITPRTKAVIPVHLLGGPCDMDRIMETARKRGIAVLEDCAQCVGGSYRGKKLGTIGDIGIYSYQLNKMISSGEGGSVATNDPVLYERAVRFHDMGGMRSLFQRRLGESRVDQFAGENFRMSEFTGAVLSAQLPKLDKMIAGLQRAADAVRVGIKDLPGIHFRKHPDLKGDLGYAVYFKLSNREARDKCIDELRKRRIPAGRISGSVLLPVSDSVVKKQVRHPKWPSFNSPEGRAIEYGPDTCRQTLDVYNRFVQVRMGPKYTDRDTDRVVAAIREVWPQVT